MAVLRSLALAAALLLPPLAAPVAAAAEGRRGLPHIVLIVTDNHGPWTLGCYGNEDIRTPNLDRLAGEGALFSHAFSVNPVCSPTRASILTGLMPSQHGVMTPADPKYQMGPEARNLLADFTSLPEILKAAGYRCGLSGKWHLGANLHPQEGLDDLWVTMPVGSTQRFYGAEIIENGTVRTEPGYMTDLWTERAVGFIEEGGRDERPMFLYLAYNGPYGLGRLLLEPARNRHAEHYAAHPLPSFPRVPTRPWQFSNREYVNNLDAFRRYAAEVSGVDDGVGSVLEALRRAGMEEDTLVVFTADQGLGSGHHNLWGMGDHTRPLHAFDATMHVPLLMRQPGVIPAGRRIDRLVSQVDLLPTVLQLAGLGDKLPDAHPLPGRDLSGLLTEEGDPAAPGDGEEEAVFYEFENTRAIRTRDWKLVERIDDEGRLPASFAYDELYDLREDPGETRNLYGEPGAEEAREALAERLRKFFAVHSLPEYDMWSGGDSQTHNIVMGETAAERHRSRVEERGMPAHPFDAAFNPPPMTIPEGLVVETVAAPPLVRHPVAVCLDDEGRLFVCENTGDNLDAEELSERLQNQVTVLTDTNGDGIYDESRVFADGFTFPQGVLWHDGALYVASPPSIWKLVDSNGDGTADQRTEIASGFGFTGNAASVHTPRLSPTGRIFWAHGRKASRVVNIAGEVVHEGETARIWSCLPDGSGLDWFCGGGMANPVELDFWKTGEVIGNVNILMRDPSRSDCLVHWQHRGVYPRRSDEKALAEFTGTGDLLREIHDFGHVAVAGLTRYRSGALSPEGEDWTDHFFVTQFNDQELLRLRVEREGSSFRAVAHPFLTVHDPDVRLVSVIEDADGSLLLTDTGGWFRIGCPASGVAKPEIPGAIYRIRKAGVWEVGSDFRGASIDWGNASPEHLAALLGDSRHAVRKRAATALAGRGETASPAVAELLSAHPDAEVRIRAAFALARTGGAAARNALRFALSDLDPEVRLAAAHAVGESGDRAAAARLLPNLHHASKALQRETAVALGRIGNPDAIPALAAALCQPPLERPLEHALIRALIDLDDPGATRAALADLDPVYGGNPDYLRRRMIVLDRIDPEGLAVDEVAPHLLHDDAALRDTAITLMASREQWAGEAAGALEEFRRAPQWDRIDSAQAILASGARDRPAIRAELAPWLASEDTRLRAAALGALGSAPGLEADPEWLPPLRSLLENGSEGEISAVFAAVKDFDPQPFEEEARALGRDEGRPALLRVRALRISGSRGNFIDAEAFDLLASLLEDPGASPGERIEACRLLADGRLDREQTLRAAAFMAGAGPLEFPVLFEAVRPRRDDLEIGERLARAYLEAPGAGAVPARERQRLLTVFHPPEFWREWVERLEEQVRGEAETAQRISRLEAAVVAGEGDAERGREIALAAVSTCVACHRIGEAGIHVGPDLSRIGRIRTARDLIESILLPSATIAQEYEGKVLTTADGEILSGVIRSESPDAVEIGLATGEFRSVPRSGIRSLEPLPVSLMPEGLDRIFTEEQLVDLVTYLESLR